MDPEQPQLSPSLEAVVKEHLELIHQAILQRAAQLALEEASANPGQATTPPSITPTQCLKAISQIAPGGRVDSFTVEESIPFWHRFAGAVSPITLISSFLTIVFAGFGLWALLSPRGASINGQAYLDIAKIFAGAIVGSASVAAVSTTRTRVVSNDETTRGSKAGRKRGSAQVVTRAEPEDLSND
jgi:hypothetical protein